MENEKLQPTPLSGQEVQDAILFKVSEDLRKSGQLHFDNAYSSFSAKIRIELILSDYGREVRDNHEITEAMDTGLEGTPEYVQESNLVMEPMPPNQLRVETEQAVPVTTVVDGKQKTRHVKYTARKAKQ